MNILAAIDRFVHRSVALDLMRAETVRARAADALPAHPGAHNGTSNLGVGRRRLSPTRGTRSKPRLLAF